jgi:hypothetical protein
MSQLQIATNNFGNFRLNVLSFSSPIFGSINGVQTKRTMRWYPIKANQPEIQFDVQFIDERDYETFQKLVRNSQVWSLEAPRPMVNLNWPERNINNWSGLITKFQAGGMRANPAPRASFTVYLFDSFISQYSELASIAPTFTQYFSFASNVFSALIPNPYNMRLPNIPLTQIPGINPPQEPNTVTPTTETEEEQ